MSAKIAICDDSAEDVEKLSLALNNYNPMFEIITYYNGQTLINDVLADRFAADILFLDIYMPVLDGIQTAKQIRSLRKDLRIIFLTTSMDHYPQSYEVFAFNYIVKPFKEQQLYHVLQYALKDISKTDSYKISFQYKGSTYTMDYREIIYIESLNRLILYYLSDRNIIQRYGKLNDIEKEMPKHYFVRCHQSFLVNLSYVEEMGDNYFRIGKNIINISRKYRKDAKDRYFSFLFSKMNGGYSGEK